MPSDVLWGWAEPRIAKEEAYADSENKLMGAEGKDGGGWLGSLGWTCTHGQIQNAEPAGTYQSTGNPAQPRAAWMGGSVREWLHVYICG